MSVIAKKWAATSFLALAITVTSYPVSAQGLDRLFNRASESEASSAATDPVQIELEKEIDSRLRSITNRIGTSEAVMPTSDTLTVEDLDRLQREANRASAQNSLKDAEYAAIRSEIEMLIFLQSSVAEIKSSREEANGTPRSSDGTGAIIAEEPQVDVEALRAQWEAEKSAEAAAKVQSDSNAAEAAERGAIPRLQTVKGGAGFWEAEIESARGVMQFVSPGDALADGFVVESIDGKGVVVRAASSGNRYSLIPSPPAPTDGPGSMGGQPAQAQNLAQGGGGLF